MAREDKTISFVQAAGFVWHYWKRHPRMVGAIAAGQVAIAAAQVTIPWLSGRLIDSIALPDADLMRAGIILAILVATIFFVDISRFIYDRLWIAIATKVMSRLVQDAFHNVQRFSTDWHANNFAGATVRKITRGMWGYDTFADTMSFGIVPTALIVVGAMLMLSIHWPVMGLFIAGAVCLYIVVNAWMATYYVAPTNKAFVDHDSDLGGHLADAITCNAVVKTFGAESREEARTEQMTDTWRQRAQRAWNRHVDMFGVQFMILLVMQGGLLAMALYYWSQGAATPGAVTQVLTTYMLLNGYLRDLGQHMRNLQQAINDMHDVVGYRTMPAEVVDRPDAVAFQPGAGHIRFEKVRFGYANQNRVVYDDFSIDIAPGEKVALVGRSGSGKSTFVRLVQRLHDVHGGRVVIDGQDVRTVTQESLRQAIALVPQEPLLFHRSLGENIAYARPGARPDEVMAAARKAHAHDFISQLRDGYDTLVGERGVKLSGGERQRVAIARAFLADAPVLILDEATSSLDSVTETHIQQAMHDLMQGRTTILIAHRLSTIQSVDRILVFADGKVVEQGTHDDLMATSNGLYYALYKTQHGRDTVIV